MSEKHAGFVINRENASPEEIRDLIEAVRTRVFETSGVRLEPEVKLLASGRPPGETPLPQIQKGVISVCVL